MMRNFWNARFASPLRPGAAVVARRLIRPFPCRRLTQGKTRRSECPVATSQTALSVRRRREGPEGWAASSEHDHGCEVRGPQMAQRHPEWLRKLSTRVARPTISLATAPTFRLCVPFSSNLTPPCSVRRVVRALPNLSSGHLSVECGALASTGLGLSHHDQFIMILSTSPTLHPLRPCSPMLPLLPRPGHHTLP